MDSLHDVDSPYDMDSLHHVDFDITTQLAPLLVCAVHYHGLLLLTQFSRSIVSLWCVY